MAESFWGPILSAGIGAGAALFGSAQSARSQEDANELNARIAREQMQFQLQGMQNRHQWEVEDLKKAGLNPMLSANSTPGIGAGASSHMENPRPNRGELYLSTAKSISDMMLTREMVKTEKTKQELNRAETESKRGQFHVPGFLNVPIDRLKSGFAHSASRIRDFFNNSRS